MKKSIKQKSTKKFFGICAYYKYVVKIKTRGSAYCGVDFEGDGKFEDYDIVEQETLNGSELMKLFSTHLKAPDICDFTIDGKNTFHFGFFEPNNGSCCDINYTLIKEEGENL